VLTIKTKNRNEYAVPVLMLEQYKAAYPGLDVEGEIRRMALWCDVNHTKRKTEAGMPRFINTWLARSYSAVKAQKAMGGFSFGESI
jgi:hypothetical protein